MNAGELAGRFGLAMSTALEARGDLVAAQANLNEALVAVGDFTAAEEQEVGRTARLAASDARWAATVMKTYESAARKAALKEAAREENAWIDDETIAEWAAEWAADQGGAEEREAARRARESKRAANAARAALDAKLARPEFAALESDAAELAAFVTELREDTAKKTETAEDLRRQATSAYRIAAEAWRTLTA